MLDLLKGRNQIERNLIYVYLIRKRSLYANHFMFCATIELLIGLLIGKMIFEKIYMRFEKTDEVFIPMRCTKLNYNSYIILWKIIYKILYIQAQETDNRYYNLHLLSKKCMRIIGNYARTLFHILK